MGAHMGAPGGAPTAIPMDAPMVSLMSATTGAHMGILMVALSPWEPHVSLRSPSVASYRLRSPNVSFSVKPLPAKGAASLLME